MIELKISFSDEEIRRAAGRVKPGVIRAPLARALVKLVAAWERVTKGSTPVRTGNLRRSIMTDATHVKDTPRPFAVIGTRTIYAAWIETGQTKDGTRKMKSRPGGYRMFEQGRTAAEAALGASMTTMGREIAEELRR